MLTLHPLAAPLNSFVVCWVSLDSAFSVHALWLTLLAVLPFTYRGSPWKVQVCAHHGRF